MAEKGDSRRDFLRMGSVFSSFLLTRQRSLTRSKAQMSKTERVKGVLQGERMDRIPFTFWRHFDLENPTGEKHAEATVAFYRKFDVDLLKVMSDFAYPLPKDLNSIAQLSDWQRMEPLKDPFPEQIKALRLINRELKGQTPFVETVFNSWTVAERLSSQQALAKLKEEDPKMLRHVLRVISESQVNHVRMALDAGAAGIFLYVAAADISVMDQQEYLKLVRESDLLILGAGKDGGYLNILHIHGRKPHFDNLLAYPVNVINWSVHSTDTSLAAVRRKFSGTLMGGLNEDRIAGANNHDLEGQILEALQVMDKRRFILAPGGNVPDTTADESLMKIKELAQG